MGLSGIYFSETFHSLKLKTKLLPFVLQRLEVLGSVRGSYITRCEIHPTQSKAHGGVEATMNVGTSTDGEENSVYHEAQRVEFLGSRLFFTSTWKRV